MARAKAYDPYEDPGLALSEDEVATFDMAGFVQRRVDQLCARGRWINKRAVMNLSKPELMKRIVRLVQSKIGWYVRVAELKGLDYEETLAPPTPQSKAGKELAASVHRLPLRDWLVQWRDSADSELRLYVTTSRRAGAVQGWAKAKWKQSNRIANAIQQEVNAAVALLEDYDRSPVSEEDKED